MDDCLFDGFLGFGWNCMEWLLFKNLVLLNGVYFVVKGFRLELYFVLLVIKLIGD